MNAEPTYYESDWRFITPHDFHTFEHGLRVQPRHIVVRVRNGDIDPVLEVTDAVAALDESKITITGARVSSYKFVQVWCSTIANPFVWRESIKARAKTKTPWLKEVDVL